MNNTKPIGIFDSGIGGLTVAKRLSQTIPNENIIYFGDTARVPYGSKSNSTVIEYSIQDTNFLISKDVKAIVVACNTASSVAIPELKKQFDIPIIGMIEPGALMAIKKSANKRIGIIGTRATISNKAYSREINSTAPGIDVYEKACPLFVPLAEEGWLNHKATYDIVEEYLQDLKDLDIDTLVLGCTHYPILYNVIREFMGDKVTLIDSGVAAACAVKKEIKNTGLENELDKPGVSEFYVSDIPTTFKKIAELFLGKPIPDIKKVNLETLSV